jgi:hypothetical protein
VTSRLGLVLATLATLLALPVAARAEDLPSLDAKLHAKVLREAPGLRTALAHGQRFKAAEILLRWASPRITTADASRQVQELQAGLGDVFFNYYQPATLGSMCGGAADFFARLLESFGIEAIAINYGYDSVLSHATTLVPMSGNEHWAMLDPTFNAELVSKRTGKPVTFATAVRTAAHGQADQKLRLRSWSLAKRKTIAADGSVKTCGQQRGACSFDAFARTLPGAGRRGQHDLSAALRLFGEGQIFSASDYPAEVLEAQARYKRVRGR